MCLETPRHQFHKMEYAMTDRVGQLFGNYQLISLLGRGGFAEVYLGKHRYLNGYAALKVLNTTLHPGDERIFWAEAQRLLDLRHPDIVRLLDFGVEKGTPVLIMDYAPKGSLRQAYPHGTQMSFTTIVDFVAQIADALQYAHNHHVIHRDIKPENILLSTENRLLLSDFGLSLLTPSSRPLSMQDPAGTPRYMAPEQLRGKPCFATDQYALAVMVYEWLCGELPFCGNIWAILHQHMDAAPPSLRHNRPDIPVQLEQIVLRALEKKPEDRFVCIQAFAWAFARACQTSFPVEEDDSQITAPMQPVSRSLPEPENKWRILKPTKALAHASQQLRHITEQQKAPAKHVPSPPLIAAQNRTRMLQRLQMWYRDLMNDSLQHAVWLDLELAEKSDALQNPTTFLVQDAYFPERLLPPGTSIVEVYEAANQELMILGEPGSGKSTQLYKLAQYLLQKAEDEQTRPLPIVFSLSSWAVKRAPLSMWMMEQLNQVYQVPRGLARQWVHDQQIIPLLDGLDEMEEKARPHCIKEINRYHQEHLHPLVVCSRSAEYTVASQSEKFALQRAVVVQLLTSRQIETTLNKGGKQLAEICAMYKGNAVLQDLVNTPLLLNLLILTYKGTTVHDLPKSGNALQQHLLAHYVQRMVTRKGNKSRYPQGYTLHWLSWLARQMQKQNQTVFAIELLQPNWLEGRLLMYYNWSVRLIFGSFGGLVIGLIGGLLIRLLVAPITGLFGGLIIGLIVGQKKSITLAERISWSGKKIGSWLIGGLIGGLIFTIASIILGKQGGGLSGALLFGLVGSIVGTLISGILGALTPNQNIDRHTLSPREGLHRSFKNGLIFWLIFGLLFWLIFGLLKGFLGPTLEANAPGLLALRLNSLFAAWPFGRIFASSLFGMVFGFLFGSLFGLFFGLIAFFQHLLLRFWLWKAGFFPWGAGAFLEDTRARYLLRRIGGSYQFVHRSLLDYFTDLEPHVANVADTTELATSATTNEATV